VTERIIIAGAGGQGIMLLGKVLAEAAMRENKFVTWLPAYGAEVRGGTAHCMVTVSDKKIGTPYLEKTDILIIMNAPSLKKFFPRLKAGGLLIANSSLVRLAPQKMARTIKGPFTDIAVRLGNIKVANMAALGCLIAQKKIVSFKTVLKVITDMAPKGKEALIQVNQKALEEGAGLK